MVTCQNCSLERSQVWTTLSPPFIEHKLCRVKGLYFPDVFGLAQVEPLDAFHGSWRPKRAKQKQMKGAAIFPFLMVPKTNLNWMPNPTSCCCLDFRTSWAVWAKRCRGSAVPLDENKSSWNICGFMHISSIFCSIDCLLPLDGAFSIDEFNHYFAFKFFSPCECGCASRSKALKCLGWFFFLSILTRGSALWNFGCCLEVLSKVGDVEAPESTKSWYRILDWVWWPLGLVGWEPATILGGLIFILIFFSLLSLI